MNELIIPPSPNWYTNSVFVCSPDNIVIYGSRRDLVIINPRDSSEPADIKIISSAHNDRIVGVSLNNASWGNPNKLAVSVGEDRIVKLWNIDTCKLKDQHREHEKNPDVLVGVSFAGERIITVSESGHIIIWRYAANTVLHLPDIFGQKVKIRCMATCPHAYWLTAFGLYSGLVLVADLRKNGRVLYKMRGNENEVTSLSWCPGMYNIYKSSRGLQIENVLKNKSEKGKYVTAKKTEVKDSSDAANSTLEEEPAKCPPQDENPTKNIESSAEPNCISDEKRIKNELNSLKLEDVKSEEENDSDDALFAEHPKYPEEKKRYSYKKVDKKNPWGAVAFDDSDHEEEASKIVPEEQKDFVSECKELLQHITQKTTDEAPLKNVAQPEVSSECEDLVENIGQKAKNVQKLVQKKPENGEELTTESSNSETLDCSSKEVDQAKGRNANEDEVSENATTVEIDSGVVTGKKDEVEDKSNEKLEEDPICQNSCSDLSSNTVLESKESEEEYLLASACKGGIICIWRAKTDGRMQLLLPAIQNKMSDRKKREDKKNRWISLCWIKPEVLISSSTSNDVYSWDLLPSVDLQKKLNKSAIFKPRLIQSDHKRNVFAIVAPYRTYSYVEDEENWRSMDDLHIWTMSQDRWILCTSLNNTRKVLASYPCMGGFVSAFAASPLDPSSIAIGVADPSVRIWNLSQPHTQRIIMTCLWDKIKSRVTCLDWHPIKESYLAFATNEGRVGEFDVKNLSKPPVVFSSYHGNAVYRIQWGPLLNAEDGIYGLYSCSGGQLVVHDTSKPTVEPFAVRLEDCKVTTFAWKSDYSVLAIGTKEGCVKLLSRSLEVYESVYMQKKAVQYLVWHLPSTVADSGLSPFANYLAVATNEPTIFVYNCVSAEDKNESNASTVVATLQGHSSSVRGLSWCPHIGGRLASCSEDGSAMVWDVPSQTLLSTYKGQGEDNIFCILWSPLDADLVMTGSRDNTLRVWRVSKNPPESTARKEKKKSKKSKVNEEKENAVETFDTVTVKKETEKVAKTFLLPSVSRLQNPEQGRTMTTCEQLLQMYEESTLEAAHDSDDESSSEDDDEEDIVDADAMSVDPIQLFGSRKDMISLLQFEQNLHTNKNHWDCSHHISLWRGNLAKSIDKAVKAGVLNPWIISIAPMVSFKYWSELCQIYADKLAEEGRGLMASSYYLACHKIYKAVEVLCSSDLYKEALAMAKCRLPSDDPVITSIYEKWVQYAVHVGNFEIAAQCYVKLGKLSEAGEILIKRDNIESLEMAAKLAEKSKNTNLLTAANTKLEMLKKQKLDNAKNIESKYPIINICESRFEALMAHEAKQEEKDDE